MIDPQKQNKQDGSSDNVLAGLLDSDIIETASDLTESALKKGKNATNDIAESTSEISDSVGDIAESAVEHIGDIISGLFD